MAQVTTRRLGEGDSKLILHAFLESDGTGELADHVLISPADLVPPLALSPTLRILQVWYSFVWFDVVLKFGGIVPRHAWTLARDAKGHFDFRHFGGIADNKTVPPSDDNGKILLSTNGFELGSQGSLIIEFRK